MKSVCLFFSCVILVLFPKVCTGQKISRRDSLNRVLASLPPENASFSDDTLRALILYNLTISHYTLSDSARLFRGKLHSLVQRLNWPEGKFYEAFTTGEYLLAKGQFFEAMGEFYQAMGVTEKTKRLDQKGFALRYISDCFYSLKQYERSIAHLKQAAKLLKSQNKPVQYLMCLNNIGMAYIELKKYTIAENYLLSCLYQNHQMSKPSLLIDSYCLEQLSNVNQQISNLKKAEYYLKESIKIRVKLKTEELYELYPKLTEIYLLKNTFDKAKKYADSSAYYADKTSVFYRARAFDVNYKLYKAINDPIKALYYYEKYISLRDSNERDNTQKRIDGIRYEYENQEQKLKISNLNQSLATEQKIKIVLLTSLILFLLLMGILWQTNKNLKKEKLKSESLGDQLKTVNDKLSEFNKELESRVNQRTSELQEANEELIRKNKEIQEAFFTGKSQERKRVASELHDNLGSTISALIWQIDAIMPVNLTEREERIYTNLLNKMREAYLEIRHISHNLMPVELSNGITLALRKLVNDLNYNSRIHFKLIGEFPTGIIAKAYELEMYSISLEIINNVLKHSTASTCLITLEYTPSHWAMSFMDNGQGFNVDIIQKEDRGKGLKNIKDRVQLINGYLKIESEENQGSRFIITIPKVQNN